MNMGRKIDFGTLKMKKNNGFSVSPRYRLSASTNPIKTLTGTEIAKATSASNAVVTRSACTAGRCRMSHKVASTSLAGGSNRGLTNPVRDNSSHSPNSPTTIDALTAGIFMDSRVERSGLLRNWDELGGENFLDRSHILHSPHSRQVQCPADRVRRHAPVHLQSQYRMLVLFARDISGNFVNLGNKLDCG